MKKKKIYLICMAVILVFSLFGSIEVYAQKLPDVEVRMHNGRPTSFIDGNPHALAGYSPAKNRPFYDKYMPLFYKHGMGVYLIWIGRLPEDYYGTLFWVGDRVDSIPLAKVPPDFFGLDAQVEHILNGDPDAYIIVRFYTPPPKSWSTLHPAEFFITEDGVAWDKPSLASDMFWDRASELCNAIVGYCESRPWANRVIGYNNHYLDEGTHVPVADGWLFDHNPAMVQKWREFLKKKYGTVEKLRKAHNDTTLSFVNIQVPKDRLRRSMPEVTQLSYWQPSIENQPLCDYLELTRDLWHLRFRQSSEAQQKGAKRKVLILHNARLESKGIFWVSLVRRKSLLESCVSGVDGRLRTYECGRIARSNDTRLRRNTHSP
ncbi:hypothetical protein ACFL5B_03975 [Candidatus Latescibacterota bacterium]